MKHRRQQCMGMIFTFTALLLLVVGEGRAFADPPPTINIRGQLLDASGQALSGVREYRVQFYDAATNGAVLGEALTGQAQLSPEGLFNLQVVVPSQVFLAPEAWYEIAVSSGAFPGPLTGSDVFPDRVKVESVPFALQSAEANHVEVSAVGSGIVADEEFEALSGVTSGIQDQLNDKADAFDVYLKTEVDLLQAVQDAAIADKANTADVVAKAGDTMTGALTVENSYIGVGQAVAPGTVADRLYNLGGGLHWNGHPAYLFPWTVAAADMQMAGNNGYIVDSSTLLTLTLPPSSSLAIGDTVRLNGIGAGGWKIGQNPSQSILLGNLRIESTSPGTWTECGPTQYWLKTASSADGTRLAAATNGGYLYTSADEGATWTARATQEPWQGIASSADGTKLAACVYGGYVYTSADYGASWTEHIIAGEEGEGEPDPYTEKYWTDVASSADGARLVACAWADYLYISTDFGATWTAHMTDAQRLWTCVTSSADGTRLVAGVLDGYLYTSTDSGATWTARMTDTGRYWSVLASSADGSNLLGGSSDGHLYVSTDFGATWTARFTDANRGWKGVACSQDGLRMFAIANSDGAYMSTDAGATWTTIGEARNYEGASASADGRQLFTTTYGPGRLYIFRLADAFLASTTAGVGGYLAGSQNSTVEIQYIGNDMFAPLTFAGSFSAN